MADPVTYKDSITMKTIFITGATSGIGLIVASELVSYGDKVIATARNTESADKLIGYYKKHYPGGAGIIEIILCDLSSFESIVHACDQIIDNNERIDVLINNAGLWNFSYRESHNKIEETLQVNVLAPLLISHLLLSLLLKSKDSKIIFAASALHQGRVDLSNLEFKNGFSGFKAYRQSKLEIILLCRLLARKLESNNVGVYCEHPGLVNTMLGRDAGWFSNLFFRLMGISPAKGAKTILFLTQEDKSNLVSGEYYYKNAIKRISGYSYDMQVADSLLQKLKIYLEDFIKPMSLIFQK